MFRKLSIGPLQIRLAIERPRLESRHSRTRVFFPQKDFKIFQILHNPPYTLINIFSPKSKKTI